MGHDKLEARADVVSSVDIVGNLTVDGNSLF